MPRLPRLSVAAFPQHVMQRGNNRQPCFLDDDDCRSYLDCLSRSSERCKVSIHAYVLMTNHVHLLVTPDEQDGVSRFMQAVGSRYVWYFNKRHGRTGTLWEGRYRASLVQDRTYLLTCYRYIELNPVRAGLAKTPCGYRWSSYRSNGLGEPDFLITPHAEYQAIGRSDPERRAAYRSMIGGFIETELLQAIRESIQGNRVFGSTEFQHGLEAILHRRITSRRKRGPPGRRGVVRVVRGQSKNPG